MLRFLGQVCQPSFRLLLRDNNKSLTTVMNDSQKYFMSNSKYIILYKCWNHESRKEHRNFLLLYASILGWDVISNTQASPLPQSLQENLRPFIKTLSGVYTGLLILFVFPELPETLQLSWGPQILFQNTNMNICKSLHYQKIYRILGV